MSPTSKNALDHIAVAHGRILAACRNLLGRRIALGGVEQDTSAAVRDLRAARREIDVVLQVLTKDEVAEADADSPDRFAAA